MSKKFRFVGDIHGQINVMRMALDCDADRIIFCGDFVDSWKRAVSDQIACIELALNNIGDGRVSAVWANHEWSYMEPKMRCSGFNLATEAHLIPLKEDIRKKFKPFIYEQETLVTHAGLTHQLWKEHQLGLDTFEQVLTEWSHDINSPFFNIGRARGGNDRYGGPLWCDFNHEFQPIPELKQVFGHTRGKGFREKGNAICIDTLENTKPQFLDLEL